MSSALTMPVRPAARPKGAELFSSEQFLDWLEPGVFADLINGKIVMHSPVSIRHANLVNLLERLLAAYLEASDIGGVVHRETVAVRLSPRETFLPDLTYFTAAQVLRLGANHASFAPTWVMEALSHATSQHDLGPKFTAYEAHGVQEYWVLDPMGLKHRFFRRAGDMLEECGATDERIVSNSVAGFWVRRSWLDPEKTPKVSACLKEILRGPRKH